MDPITSTSSGDPGPSAEPAAPGSLSRSGRRLVVAWVVSIASHILLFIAMFSVPWLARAVVGGEELTVAQTELMDRSDTRTTLVTHELNFGQGESAPREQLRFTPKKFETSAVVGQPQRRELSIIGLGAGGGDFSKYGLGVGGGDTGPRFFGLGGAARGARRIVYVVDRSGSMIGTFGAVADELQRSVQQLRRSMRFHVIFFNAGTPLENPPKKLVHASRKQKADLAEFVASVQPQGNTDPIPAMRRAFAVNPDVIYFLTDGEFDPLLLEKLKKWNSKRSVRIFTIAYVSQRGAALLERIAREHHGEYRFVSEYEL